MDGGGEPATGTAGGGAAPGGATPSPGAGPGRASTPTPPLETGMRRRPSTTCGSVGAAARPERTAAAGRSRSRRRMVSADATRPIGAPAPSAAAPTTATAATAAVRRAKRTLTRRASPAEPSRAGRGNVWPERVTGRTSNDGTTRDSHATERAHEISDPDPRGSVPVLVVHDHGAHLPELHRAARQRPGREG